MTIRIFEITNGNEIVRELNTKHMRKLLQKLDKIIYLAACHETNSKGECVSTIPEERVKNADD